MGQLICLKSGSYFYKTCSRVLEQSKLNIVSCFAEMKVLHLMGTSCMIAELSGVTLMLKGLYQQ